MTVDVDEAKRPKVGVGVMVLQDDMVLLGRRRGAHGEDTYGWCGGHVEFGESLEDAAEREVKEETGITILNPKLLCISNVRQYAKHYLDIEFLVTEFSGEPRVIEQDRVESWSWHKLNDLPEPLFEPVRLAIDSFKSNRLYNA